MPQVGVLTNASVARQVLNDKGRLLLGHCEMCIWVRESGGKREERREMLIAVPVVVAVAVAMSWFFFFEGIVCPFYIQWFWMHYERIDQSGCTWTHLWKCQLTRLALLHNLSGEHKKDGVPPDECKQTITDKRKAKNRRRI